MTYLIQFDLIQRDPYHGPHDHSVSKSLKSLILCTKFSTTFYSVSQQVLDMNLAKNKSIKIPKIENFK